jgi:molecular chaperone HtpG
VAIEQETPEKLFPLLRFHTDKDLTGWSSLEDYLERSLSDQKDIYYFLGDDASAVRYSPHMDEFRKKDIEVLVLTDPVDPFMLMQLRTFEDHPMVNVAEAELPVDGEDEKDSEPELSMDLNTEASLVERMKAVLGDRVSDVRTTTRLSDSPARLIDPEGAPDQSMQRVLEMMDKGFELPKKVLELNPRHRIVMGLASLPDDDSRFALVAEQVFENALLIEGLHKDPVSMVGRIQTLIINVLGDDPESE